LQNKAAHGKTIFFLVFFPMTWRRALRWLATLLVLAVLARMLYPYARQAVRVVRLIRAPTPVWLPVPVEGVEPSQLANTWGAARSEGRRHEGIDIFAPRDTQVLSATPGIVLRRGWNRLGGRTISILGPGGQTHYYAHLEGYDDPALGDWVEAGEVIGYVGDSGNAQGTPTHLHYGIYESGGAVNPYPRLTAIPSPSPAEPSPPP
jgi:murein DD-endopeptidase MepM/ murein hydrolase activator NlpD